ncbi:uncharacterized protein An14g02440 [Aspergillus niger]|uniref:Contig An14c0100, genomic contig n=2 Tax=Aspergillus niger TaxID=5061 RepID=A2R2Z0_ASPNC|nr:uncharacterized protein An14g02440 [Aspergillus niger]CAK41981.1 unnamed protein product [Aspergillus niger]
MLGAGRIDPSNSIKCDIMSCPRGINTLLIIFAVYASLRLEFAVHYINGVYKGQHKYLSLDHMSFSKRKTRERTAQPDRQHPPFSSLPPASWYG